MADDARGDGGANDGASDARAAPEARPRRARGSGTGTRNTHASGGRFSARERRARAPGGDDARESAWWKTLDDEACDPITLEPLRGMAYAPFEMEGAEGGGDGGDGARDARRGHMFDGAVLAEYVTRSRCFENPLTREALDQRQCRALDAYLAKWKLKRFGVEKAFNAAAKEKREAELNAERRSEEQRLNMQRERDELRTTLAQTMFTSLRERASAERGGGGGGADGRRRRDEHSLGGNRASSTVPRSTSISDALAELQSDGRFALVDDDVSMLRDVSLADGRGADARGPRPQDHGSLASWGGWSRPSHIENRGNDFPELPGARSRGGGSGNWVPPVAVPDASRGDSFPTLDAGSSRATPSWGTFAPRASAAERFKAIPRSTAATIFAKKTLTSTVAKKDEPSTHAASAAPVDEATARRNKLAEAFGVTKPDERPSMFADSSASAFTRAQLVLARKHPDLVKRLEATLEDIVTCKSKRRVSMEPMNREMRELCHVVAELYGITSASFGADPKRHIDFFAGGNKGGVLPSLRLSDAILVDLDSAPTKGTLASKTRPEEATEYFDGYTKHFSKGEYEELAMSFTDITVGVAGVKASLREFSGNYVLQEIDDDHVVAHFWKHGTLLQASGKLGGGMRGKFRVKILEKRCKGKEPEVATPAEPSKAELKKPATGGSTSARLFRASTARSSSTTPPVDGQAAIDEALNMFGF